jgi:hypothetical protein
MIVEVRSYRIKPGRRAEFIKFFETRAVPALRSHGMKILGPLLDLENPNKFVWLRSFPSLDERERMRDAFYEGDVWKGELEGRASWKPSPCRCLRVMTSSCARHPPATCLTGRGRIPSDFAAGLALRAA